MKLVSLGLLLIAQVAHAQQIQSYKDDLFSNTNRKVLEARDNGAYKRYYWEEMEDVNGRDAIPGVEAKPERIDLAVSKDQRSISVPYRGGALDTYEIGKTKDANFAVIFVHGAGGSKELGFSDKSFGGNFNRLKNLAVKNNGVYYSPTVQFNDEGDKAVLALIDKIRKDSPKAKIVIACGSAGAHTCWQMYDQAGTKLSGVILTGGARDHQNFQNSQGFINETPLIMSHGTKDRLVPWTMYQAQYDAMKKVKSNYPMRLELFEGGKHGTPMRNIDWKESLEWVFAHSKRPAADSKSGKDKKASKAMQ